jgi:putative membrane protein
MTHYKLKLPVLLCSCALFAVGCADRHMGGTSDASARAGGTGSGSGSGQTASADAQFVRDAASMGLAEIQMGQLVQQRAQNQELRQFGQQLVSDHAEANQELTTLAARKGIQLPAELKADDRQTMTRLSSAEGAEFDRLAKQEAIKAHQTAIQKFEVAKGRVQDPDLRAFIDKNLPALQEHLQHAQSLPESGASSAQGGSDMLEGTSVEGTGASSSEMENPWRQQGRSLGETDQLSPGRHPEPDSATPTIPE